MNTLLHDQLAKGASSPGGGRDVMTKQPPTGDNYQSHQLFTRMLWKEYRQLRPIWIALAALVFTIASMMASRIVAQHPAITGNLILFVPCLFSLSAGALFFANETEQKTDRWLTEWTVPVFHLFVAKYLVALGGSFLLALFAASIAYIFGLPMDLPANQDSWPIKMAVAGMIGSYVFTSTASVMTGHVLTSAVIGGTATWSVLYFLSEYLTGGHTFPIVDPLLKTIIISSPIVFLSLLAICLVLAPFALAKRLSGQTILPSTSRSPAPRASLVQAFHEWRQPHPAMVLLWKEFRQSRLWVLGIVAFTIYVVLGVTWFGWTKTPNPFAAGVSALYLSIEWFEGRPVEILFLFISSIFMGVAYLSGLLTFMAEQRGRSFRFLTHQGLSARQLWILKQVFWLPIIFVWIALLMYSSFTGRITLSYLWAPWAMLTAYATFQLAILLIPQAIIALVTGLCGSVLLYYSLAMTLLDVPFWVLVIPMPLCLLFSSFVLSRSWMEERNGWTVAAQKFAIVFGPMAFLFVATCLFRVFEIPATPAKDLLPAHLPPATSEELATANAYAEVLYRLKAMNDDKLESYADELFSDNRRNEYSVICSDKLIEKIIEITERTDGMFTRLTPGVAHDGSQIRHERAEFQLLAIVLLDAANTCEMKGEWERAGELYLATVRLSSHANHRGNQELRSQSYQSMHRAWRGLIRWAKQPSTTVDQIIDAIQQLQDNAIIPATAIRDWWLADQDIHYSEYPYYFASKLVGVTYFLAPWEECRAIRLKEYEDAYHLREMKSFIDSPSRDVSQQSFASFDPNRKYPWQDWERSTPTENRYPDFGWAWGQVFRRNLCVLATIAWMKKYGDLPDDLFETCQQFVGERIVSVTNGEPFQIARLGNRFQIIAATDDEWQQKLKAKYSDPKIEDWGFSWRDGEGYSTDPNEK